MVRVLKNLSVIYFNKNLYKVATATFMPSWWVTVYCFIPLLNTQKEYLYWNCVNCDWIWESSSLTTHYYLHLTASVSLILTVLKFRKFYLESGRRLIISCSCWANPISKSLSQPQKIIEKQYKVNIILHIKACFFILDKFVEWERWVHLNRSVTLSKALICKKSKACWRENQV